MAQLKHHVTGSFAEKYEHLSMKHTFGFAWIAQHCRNAKYVLKADDDVIVNLPYLQTVLQVAPLRRSIVGRVLYFVFCTTSCTPSKIIKFEL